MPIQHSSRSVELAKQLVSEAGSQKALASLAGVKQPSVWLWTRYGFGAMREAFLRERLPDFAVWTRFPPVKAGTSASEPE